MSRTLTCASQQQQCHCVQGEQLIVDQAGTVLDLNGPARPQTTINALARDHVLMRAGCQQLLSAAIMWQYVCTASRLGSGSVIEPLPSDATMQQSAPRLLSLSQVTQQKGAPTATLQGHHIAPMKPAVLKAMRSSKGNMSKNRPSHPLKKVCTNWPVEEPSPYTAKARRHSLAISAGWGWKVYSREPSSPFFRALLNSCRQTR